MNKTMQNVMKPVNPNTISATSADTKAAQEAVVMDILNKCPYSMTSRDVGDNIQLPTFPGFYPDWLRWMPMQARSTRMASIVLRRLERKGALVSTLYQGYRLYSIPVVNGGEN